MRWRPTTVQKFTLERVFATSRAPLPETLECLAASLGLTTKQVRIYFQNRRLRRKEIAMPITTPKLLSPPTSSPTTFQFAQQFAPISTPPRALSAKVLGFIHPNLGHPTFRPVSPTAAYTTSGLPTKKAMLIKQSTFLASNLRPGFTLAEAQQGIASALQHAQQHIDENSTHFSKRAHFSSPHFDRAEDAPTYFSPRASRCSSATQHLVRRPRPSPRSMPSGPRRARRSLLRRRVASSRCT
ncbi:hypothetical protein T492DRAFT_957995 [Pavlovales sp. CCMP2436]|nr:hypothetical protein T492DRAFT_957995 [Pavlovales sp. CCMP2436]